jgi:hypothetical protein
MTLPRDRACVKSLFHQLVEPSNDFVTLQSSTE